MNENGLKLVRKDPYRLWMEKQGEMVVDALVYTSERINLEPDAVRQLQDAASIPNAVKVLATADIHVGFGVPIGCVMGLKDAIMPAAVGYDINCGMRLMNTPFKKEDINPEAIAQSIARDIPLGEGKSNLTLDTATLEAVAAEGVKSLPFLASRLNHRAWEAFDSSRFKAELNRIEDGGSMEGDLACVPDLAIRKGSDQLGTLGGGNHFIEIQCVQKIFDTQLAAAFNISENQIVVMIHSGSRRFGYEVADDYMNVAAAQPDMAGRRKMLSYLSTDTKQGRNYIKAMSAAANYAFLNRHIMALLVQRCFNRMFGNVDLELIYDVPHNMAKLENYLGQDVWVHRKGATRAFGPKLMAGTIFEKTGQPIITPGSMGTASYLMVGTEQSEESLYSVNHGAGRVMSRSAASGKSRHGKSYKQELITDDEFKRSMKGIKLIAGDRSKIKEEAPQAYKDIDEVVNIVTNCGWAKPVARMVPLAVLKG